MNKEEYAMEYKTERNKGYDYTVTPTDFNGRPMNADSKVKRQGEIAEVCERLDRAIEILGVKIDEVSSVISPILNKELPKESNMKQEKLCGTDVGVRLESMLLRIEERINILTRLTNRVEL